MQGALAGMEPLQIAGFRGLPLVSITPPGWTDLVLADFDHFLLDHAACERKAAALCMSLVTRYADRPQLIEPLVALAREELEHFAQVHRLLQQRRVTAVPDERDPYINELMALMRHGRDERLLDHLVIAGLIEARGCERFFLLADALPEGGLKDFYLTLSRSEAGHFKVFLRLAGLFFPEAEVSAVLRQLAAQESQVMLVQPLRAAVH